MPNLTSIISSQISDLYGDIWFFPSLSAPPKSEHGEYCFGVFTLAKPISKAPNIIAEEIAAELRKDIMYFTQVNVIGGYVNFSCTSWVWIDIFSDIQKNKIEKKWETIIIDYIGANIGKPLHIWHLCTPSIGQTIYNVYSYLGYRVIGDSHFCDWGGILWKLIAGGKEDSKNNTIELLESVENKWVDYLLEIYQNTTKTIEKEKLEGKSDFDTKSREEFRKLTQWDVENIELWKNFTKISVAEIEKKLDLLNVHATYNIWESFYEWLNLPRPNNEDYPALTYKMKDIVTELIEKWVAKQNDDGSVGVSFPEETKMPSCILQKKDGTWLYLTSDLGAIKYRLTNGWNPTKIIYSVDVRQQLHLKQAFWIAQKAWPELTEWVEFFHAFNGFIKLKEWAMSTRHGTVIFLESSSKNEMKRHKRS